MLSKDELDAIAERQNDSYLYSYRHKPFDDIDALLQHIRELEAVIAGIAKSEPIDYDSYSKCTYCGGGMSLANSKKSPLQEHKNNCPWLKARQLVTPQAGAGGGDDA